MKKYLAEVFGTFVLVFGGVGSAVLAGGKIGNVGVAFAFGISLLAMVYTIGPISGCHINPAVTFGVLLAKKISFRDSVGYVIAQIVGATIASGAILAIARQFTELSDIYGAKKLDQSGQVTMLCGEADAALALAAPSADVKAQQKKIAAIRAKASKK